jgi:hypothetical protein
MAIVLEHVGDVASESTNSQSFHVPGSAQYIELLEADPDIMKLVGESYTSGSYKAVRCLGKSFCMPKHLNLCFQSFSVRQLFRRLRITSC